jgi:cyclopropane fatty-acyl-phospholipid synthase-like methyltransferase
MSFKTAIVGQFGKPSGLIGELAGRIMARRSSNRLRNQRTVELVALQPGSRVLEVGCGPGLALTHCAEQAGIGRVVGLDHSSVMIGQARKRLQDASLLEKVTLHFGGVERMADWPMAFDRIYSLNVIQFIPDKAGYFRMVYETLDTGGMCFTTYQPRMDNGDPNGAALMADAIAALMQIAGFGTIVRTEINAGSTPALCVSGVRV